MRARGGNAARPAIALALCAGCGLVADVQAQLRSRLQASGFAAPVAFVQDPTDRAVQFVVQQGGRIRVVRSGTVLPADFIDLSSSIVAGGEQGLLGLAFAPDAAVSRRVFVNFTNRSGDTVVARLRRSSDPVVADPASRFDLRWGGAGGRAFIEQPFANHNGGNLVFGPDGYLYIGLGDGGSGDDPDHRAQNPLELLGKMLRIDVSVPDAHPTGYQVPADNPFVRGVPVAARPEIWAFGLRNPWRYSFDDPSRGGTGAMVIADVGQNRWEEVDYEPPNRGGRNYGWRNREGTHDNVTSLAPAYLPLVEPIHEYDHAVGQSITGGYVYRGRPVLLRGFRSGPCVVDGAGRRRPERRGERLGPGRAHRRARRLLAAREHQLVRDRRGWRALRGELLNRPGSEGDWSAGRAIRADRPPHHPLNKSQVSTFKSQRSASVER